MQLERIAIRLRRRTPWEAIDLGRIMMCEWARPTYCIWFLTYWPFGLLLAFICQDMFWLASLLLWWFKPVFDRALLFVYSRALFASPTGFAEFRQALRDLLFRSGLLYGLTFGRLSLARSFVLPVWQLEGMRGKQARQRARILSRRTRGFGSLLTIICYHFVFFIYMALFVLVMFFIPEGVSDTLDIDWWFNNADTPWFNFVCLIFYMIAETLVEPFFVACGFSLYLNRRSDLEAWDIELAFRRLNARLLAAGRNVAVLAATLLILLCSFGYPEPVLAAEAIRGDDIQKTDQTRQDVRQAIDQVLADPDFGRTTKVKQWRRIKKEKKESKSSFWPDGLGWIARFVELSSQLGRVIMWIVAGIVAVGLVYLLVTYRDKWLGAGQKSTDPPDFLFGLDVRPASLPDDIAAAARDLLHAGKIEAALSLLYRGSLMRLVRHARVEFQPGDTEKDCRTRVSGKISISAVCYFGNLLDVWLDTVYAKKPPSIQILELLCRNWDEYFALSAGALDYIQADAA